MGSRMLTNPRLLAFAFIAGCYFLITIHITSNLSHEPCDKVKEKDGDLWKKSPEVDYSNQKIIHLKTPYAVAGDEENGEEVPQKTIKRVEDHVVPNVAPVGKAGVGSISKPKLEKQYIPDTHSHHLLLNSDLTTNMVYMVWCGRRWFEFSHYLSVLSAIKHLKPDNIYFYFDAYPIRDHWIYNTWIEEIKNTYPFFHPEQLGPEDHGCVGHSEPNMTFISQILTTTGGIYLNEHTMLEDYPLELRRKDFVYAYNVEERGGFISAKRGLPGMHRLSKILKSRLKTSTKHCVNHTEFKASEGAMCINIYDRIFPKDFWVEDSDFARSVRTLFYGVPGPQDAKPSYDELIPNIAHIVWIGGGEMDYLFYLGVLSLIYVAEVEVVYIHGNAPPSGPLWNRVKNHPKVKLVYRETPRTIFGTRVNIISHVTDVWRVDFMVRYGGIYVDTDTVFVNKLDRDIRAYDAVGAYDWTYWNHPFPDTINFGVAIGKRNAKFWQEFQKSMTWFIDSDWSWNGLRQPYRIKERHPELLRIDPRLQVICYEFKCHPTWWPNYHNESIHHMNSPSIKDWRTDIYAFHWTLPTPPELDDEQVLLSSTTMAAEVGRFVLQKAGLLEDLAKKYAVKVPKTTHTKQPYR